MDQTKTMIRQYWNWRSQSYGLDGERNVPAEEKWVQAFQETAGPGHGRHALDIGTGTGQFAFYLSSLGYDVTGIDLSEKMISQATDRAKASGQDINFQTGDAENLDFEDHVFDVVVSRNLLWTLPHPEQAIKEWHRVLTSGGRIIISDGFWGNDTWKRFNRFVINLFKGIFNRSGMLSLRFFSHYANLQTHLPLYEGTCFEDAQKLMQTAGFNQISPYDVARFGCNPYEDGKMFFIAHATK